MLRNNNVNDKIGNIKEREISPGTFTSSSSSQASEKKTEGISNAENISSIPSPEVKPPRPAPRAINQQGNDILDKCKAEGMLNIGINRTITES